ncbi:MAG: ABC transporter ATP-binding protein [Myxococcales bacterium]
MSTSASRPLLEVEKLDAFYGQSHALHRVGLSVGAGEVVSLIGRNGAGKSTTLKSIMGVLRKKTGAIRFEGKEIGGLESHQIARRGIAFVPEERAIFATLTVRENLVLPPALFPTPWTTERVYGSFPILKERGAHAGSKMSGGEQQMLAIAHILRTSPRLLLLDEPSEGLAPVIVQQIGRILQELKKDGMSIILVEQNLRFALGIADRHYLLVDGVVKEMLTTEEVRARDKELLNFLSV